MRKGYLFLLLTGCLVFLYSCNRDYSHLLNQRLEEKQDQLDTIKVKIIDNQKQQMSALNNINDKVLFDHKYNNIIVSYYFSPYVKKKSQYLSQLDISKNNNIILASDIRIFLDNAYEGNIPYKYAFLSKENTFNIEIRVLKTLKKGAILSIYHKNNIDSSIVSTQDVPVKSVWSTYNKAVPVSVADYYIYVDNAKGLDGQLFKQELLLEYKGEYHATSKSFDETIPKFSVVKRVNYSNNDIVNKVAEYNIKQLMFNNVAKSPEVAPKTRQDTIKYLLSKDKAENLKDKGAYSYEFGQRYIDNYSDKIKAFYNYNISKSNFIKQDQTKLYSLLGISYKNNLDQYNKTFRENYNKFQTLRQQYVKLYQQATLIEEEIVNINLYK